MAKINNKNVYNQDPNPSMKDYLIGTDGNSGSKMTKNFDLGSVFALFNRFLGYNVFVFAEDLIEYPKGTKGYFYCYDVNNQITKLFSNTKKIVFSRTDLYGDIVLDFFQKIVSSESFAFRLTNFEDRNNFIFLTPSNFLIDNTTLTFSIDITVLTYLNSGNFIPNSTYLLSLEYYSQDKNPIPIKPMELRIIARGPNNNTGNDLAGDIVEGWGTWDSNTNSGVYWKRAIYNGGNRSDRANYTPIETIDF
ncbi:MULTISPECIES: hypothetical protein [Flavobacterium]|uniref:Uncharacterized protein n=1 Tax=Flavobacterium keumense TaxID=1306518 RepID=A0ABY8N683_9FLAO|nr:MULTISPECIES: hypothetical protein [Flavobacterium]WGK93807.1 hypothetical protein MG292_06800 [Flavobacterium keumense]